MAQTNMEQPYTLIKNREHKKAIELLQSNNITVDSTAKRFYSLKIVDNVTSEYNQVTNSYDPNKFIINGVIKVDNPFSKQKFDIECQKLSYIRPTIGPNIKTRYHVSNGNVNYVCNNSIDIRYSRIGYCGKAIYTAYTPVKANDNNVNKGNRDIIRVMYVCKVVCGNILKKDLGTINTSLFKEPEGYDSIDAFYARDWETIIYDTDRSLIEYIVLYRYIDSQDELNPPKSIIESANPNGIVNPIIVTDLCNSFLKGLCENSTNYQMCFTMITDLKNGKINLHTFIENYKKITTMVFLDGFDTIIKAWIVLSLGYRYKYNVKVNNLNTQDSKSTCDVSIVDAKAKTMSAAHTLRPQPVASGQQSVASGQQPVILRPQPVASGQQPVTLRPHPVVLRPQPVTLRPQPVASATAPTPVFVHQQHPFCNATPGQVHNIAAKPVTSSFNVWFSNSPKGYPVTSAAPYPSPYLDTAYQKQERREQPATPYTAPELHSHMNRDSGLRRSESFNAADILVKMTRDTKDQTQRKSKQQVVLKESETTRVPQKHYYVVDDEDEDETHSKKPKV